MSIDEDSDKDGYKYEHKPVVNVSPVRSESPKRSPKRKTYSPNSVTVGFKKVTKSKKKKHVLNSTSEISGQEVTF